MDSLALLRQQKAKQRPDSAQKDRLLDKAFMLEAALVADSDVKDNKIVKQRSGMEQRIQHRNMQKQRKQQIEDQRRRLNGSKSTTSMLQTAPPVVRNMSRPSTASSPIMPNLDTSALPHTPSPVKFKSTTDVTLLDICAASKRKQAAVNERMRQKGSKITLRPPHQSSPARQKLHSSSQEIRKGFGSSEVRGRDVEKSRKTRTPAPGKYDVAGKSRTDSRPGGGQSSKSFNSRPPGNLEITMRRARAVPAPVDYGRPKLPQHEARDGRGGLMLARGANFLERELQLARGKLSPADTQPEGGEFPGALVRSLTSPANGQRWKGTFNPVVTPEEQERRRQRQAHGPGPTTYSPVSVHDIGHSGSIKRKKGVRFSESEKASQTALHRHVFSKMFVPGPGLYEGMNRSRVDLGYQPPAPIPSPVLSTRKAKKKLRVSRRQDVDEVPGGAADATAAAPGGGGGAAQQRLPPSTQRASQHQRRTAHTGASHASHASHTSQASHAGPGGGGGARPASAGPGRPGGTHTKPEFASGGVISSSPKVTTTEDAMRQVAHLPSPHDTQPTHGFDTKQRSGGKWGRDASKTFLETYICAKDFLPGPGVYFRDEGEDSEDDHGGGRREYKGRRGKLSSSSRPGTAGGGVGGVHGGKFSTAVVPGTMDVAIKQHRDVPGPGRYELSKTLELGASVAGGMISSKQGGEPRFLMDLQISQHNKDSPWGPDEFNVDHLSMVRQSRARPSSGKFNQAHSKTFLEQQVYDKAFLPGPGSSHSSVFSTLSKSGAGRFSKNPRGFGRPA